MMMTSSCNDWLDVLPNNEQITDNFWQSKEDVEAVVMSGYRYMRDCVPTIIKWGELRGGTFYSTSTGESKFQDFNLTSAHSLVNYESLYKVINAANSVLKYAPAVSDADDTYYDAMMKSHLCEAYFMRAYCNLILVKNYREVPLIVEPYVDDQADFSIAKSTEAEIIAQIKADILAALETGAAKGTYEEDWQTKGRATKWALYALMADVCLWSEDYETCKQYCDMILNATDSFRPVFIQSTVQWYDMFCYGNSNESIFELNWDYNLGMETNNFSVLWSQSGISPLSFTDRATERLRSETAEVLLRNPASEGRIGRSYLATYVTEGGAPYQTAQRYYLWKYAGTEIQDPTGGRRVHNDANFIIYRVSDVILTKALAETMTGDIAAAFALNNRIRVRAGIGNYQGIADDDLGAIANIGEQEMLEEIIGQRELELAGEAKRWYDLLWFGRIASHRYRNAFIDAVIDGNSTTNPSWIRSVLNDVNAWYLPLPEHDIQSNSLLVQNPYYATGK